MIRIPITISLHEDQDLNHYSTDSNLDFRKGLNGCSMKEIRIPINGFESKFQKVQTDEGDLNPSWSESNPNSSKVIEINRFESLVKKKEMLKATDSNHPFSDSNPSWKRWIKIEARIRIPYTVIRISHEEYVKRLKQGLESLTQRFESLNLELWRIRQGDSNLRVMDSNPLAKEKTEGWRSNRAIRIFELRIRILLAQNSNLTQVIRIP